MSAVALAVTLYISACLTLVTVRVLLFAASREERGYCVCALATTVKAAICVGSRQNARC
jgi:hypothetical protein